MGNKNLEALFNQDVSEDDGFLKVLRIKNAINITDGYVLSDKDDDATPNYYGHTDKDGNWYILKETILAGADTYRFIKGTSGYTTNWTNRASLSYDYFYNIF